MINKLYSEISIQDIANAIREKNGTSDMYKVSEMGNAIRAIVSGESLKFFSQINPVVESYMKNVTYDSNDYTISNIGEYASQEVDYNLYQPSGYPIKVQNGTLIIADSQNGTVTEEVTEGIANIYNIVPTTGGIYINVNDNGTVINAGKIIPTGSLRMLHIDGIRNVRDLGGWDCDGGTVKYGKIIRGTAMNGTFSISEQGKNILRNLIKIDYELDFRGDDEWTGTVSALGDDVGYSRVAYSMYSGAIVNATMQSRFIEIFRTILKCVTNGEPIYIHCESGMDRCGTVCFLLESILGLSLSDIDKDYELSSFYTYPTTLKTRNSTTYTGMVNHFLDGGTYSNGDNHRDRVVNYLLTLGITIEEINDFRKAMIDGEPGELTANTKSYSVTNKLSNTSSDNSETTVIEYQPYNTTIVPKSGYVIDKITVTMGGVDITDRVVEKTFVPNGTLNINENGEYNAYNYKFVNVNVESNGGTGETVVRHSIAMTLNGLSINNSQTEIIDGQSYGAIISANENAGINNVSVTVDGVEISSNYLIYIESE